MANYDTKKFLDYLNAKLPKVKCPLCGSVNWKVSDNVFELRQFNQGNMVIGGVPIIPLVPLTCDNCGNTILINALMSSAIEATGPKESTNG